MRYSDGHNGRCAIGLIMSYFGWNGKNDTSTIIAGLAEVSQQFPYG
jgi:hypothetical protein